MRDYQTKQNLGGVPDSNLPTKDGANEYNSLRSENKESVLRAGLTLTSQDGTGEDTTQQSQALFINGAGASSFQAAGTVDAVTLTPVTGVSGLKLPPDYVSLHGARVGFYPIGTNTGNVTISIGQDAGSQFGTKKALNEDGTELPASTLSDAIYAEFIFDETADTSNGAFILIPYSLASGGGGVIATLVEKDLSNDATYVPKVTLDGTEVFYIDDNGVPKKVSASTVASGDTLKVDKDLSDNTDYVPTSAVDDTDQYYVDKAGVPSKISGLDLKAQLTVIDIQTLTSSGLWTKPASGTRVLVQIWGAGGSGGRAGAVEGGGGGGGGAYIQVWFDIGDLGATETVTIGAGGASVTIDNTDGNVGGNTTFGSLAIIFGGGGGEGAGLASGDGIGGGGGGVYSAGNTGNVGPPGGEGGDPLGGATNVDSTFGGGGGAEGDNQNPGTSIYGGGGGGVGDNNANNTDGGDSINGGGGGGGGGNNGPNTAGGNSVSGGNGGIGTFDSTNAGDGVQPAGGGGGSETGDSGAGGAGQCIVTTF